MNEVDVSFSVVLTQYGFFTCTKGENTGSRLFTEVKPCWTGLISGWVTIYIKYPMLYSLGSQNGEVIINYAVHRHCKCCMWLEFSFDLTLTSRIFAWYSGLLHLKTGSCGLTSCIVSRLLGLLNMKWNEPEPVNKRSFVCRLSCNSSNIVRASQLNDFAT